MKTQPKGSCYAQTLSPVQLFATVWAVIHRLLCAMEFSRQEYQSRLPFPPPGDLPDPRIAPTSLALPALAGRCFPLAPPGKPIKKL